MNKITWILDFDYDFTAPQDISSHLKNFVILPKESIILDWPKINYPCVAYGSMRKMIQLIQHPKLCEAVFDNYNELRCSHYYCFLYEFLKRTCFIVPFCALLYINWKKIFGKQIFVRPNSNHKPFEAEIINIEDIPQFVEKYLYKQQNELIVVSEVVDLGKEYRCFCRNGKIFCHSSYPPPYDDTPQDVLDFATLIAKKITPFISSSMITVDIAKNDCLRLVEIGGVNSWGIYGGDVQSFIEAMEAEAIFRQQDI